MVSTQLDYHRFSDSLCAHYVTKVKCTLHNFQNTKISGVIYYDNFSVAIMYVHPLPKQINAISVDFVTDKKKIYIWLKYCSVQSV